jgi:ABC-2 type transport system ATP-binding protein
VDIRTGADAELLEVTGLEARVIGRRAAEAGIVLYELSPKSVSMEQAFMDLTRDAVDYPTHLAAPELAQSDRSAA